MANPIRVLVVDDNESMRDVIQAALAFEDDIEVVGCAEDATTAIDRTRETHPDVIVLDNQMPGRTGVEVLPDLLAMCRAVVMHTAHATAADRETALRLGAAIIEKGCDLDVLVSAIRDASD